MIYVKIKNIEKKINLQDKYVFLIIENLEYFFNIINGIKYDLESVAMFYNQKFEPLYLDKKIEVVSDYFNIDCSKSKYFYDFIKQNKFKESEDIKNALNIIYEKMDSLIEEIQYQSFMNLDYSEEVDLEYILKSVDIKFFNSMDKLENLVNYCRLMLEIYKKEIFVFVNLNLYYSEMDIILLINQLYLVGIKSIMISTNGNNIKNDCFKKIIIDNDLCEFYN